MIVVSDTSPINNLAAIRQLHLLHQLYGTVIIPEAVYRELTDTSFPVAGATEVQTLDWIQTRTISDRILVEALSNELDIGEMAREKFRYLKIKCDASLVVHRETPLLQSHNLIMVLLADKYHQHEDSPSLNVQILPSNLPKLILFSTVLLGLISPFSLI